MFKKLKYKYRITEVYANRGENNKLYQLEKYRFFLGWILIDTTIEHSLEAAKRIFRNRMWIEKHKELYYLSKKELEETL